MQHFAFRKYLPTQKKVFRFLFLILYIFTLEREKFIDNNLTGDHSENSAIVLLDPVLPKLRIQIDSLIDLDLEQGMRRARL